MTERGDSDRIDYSTPSKTELAELNESALHHIENILLLENQSLDSSLSYSYRDKTARRELETFALEDDEPYEVVYAGRGGEITSVTLERAALVTQAIITVDQYAEGNVEEAAELSVLRWVEGVEHPFRTKYLFETFKGGSIQATVYKTDVTLPQGLEERSMTPYDYAELKKELLLVTIARVGLVNAVLEQG